MIDEERLCEIIPEDVKLRVVEPHIYSLFSPGENTNAYDRMGSIYDTVACNRWYNRLVWGYWISEYHSLCLRAFGSSADGWVLDAGCGSLAFTARAYVSYSARPVVFLDQSIKLLLLAKSRLIKLNGKVPDNMVFLHGGCAEIALQTEEFFHHYLAEPAPLHRGCEEGVAATEKRADGWGNDFSDHADTESQVGRQLLAYVGKRGRIDSQNRGSARCAFS